MRHRDRKESKTELAHYNNPKLQGNNCREFKEAPKMFLTMVEHGEGVGGNLKRTVPKVTTE